jgi:transposase
VPEITKRLRVSQNAVYLWRRRRLADGEAGLVSKGPSGTGCRLSPQQLVQLATALKEGRAVHSYVEDQRWTLARVADVISRLFRVQYTLHDLSLLLHPEVGDHRNQQIGRCPRQVIPPGQRAIASAMVSGPGVSLAR